MATAPFGYCPECGKPGVTEDLGVVKCSAGHPFELGKATWPKGSGMDLDENAAMIEKKAEAKVESLRKPEVVEETDTEAADINDFVKAAQAIKKKEQTLKKRFGEIHKILKDLVDEIEGYTN